MRRAPTIAIVALLAGCGEDFTAGRAAYEAGRHEEARAAFAAEEERRGDGASAALAYARALAALRAGKPDEADAAAGRAAVRDEDAFGALAAFLRGNAAWERFRVAEAQASAPEAEPFAFQVAIDRAEAARAAWIEAATSRDDWPEARRNVERAQRTIEELRRRRTEAEAKRTGAKPTPRIVDQPSPPPDDAGATEESETDAEARRDRLDPSDVRSLLERLAAKEREKREVREARRRALTSGVEKDW